MSDEQPRADNGQWGCKPPNQTPEIHLAETVHGSFLFPPSQWPGGADEYISFWMTQPISDEALTTFVSSYAADWDDWAIPLIQDHMQMWGNSTEALRLLYKGIPRTEALAIRQAESDRFEAELENVRPSRIPTALARPVARAAQLVQNLDTLPDLSDRERARNASVHTSADGREWSAQYIWDVYQLHGIMPDAFYARENAVYRKLSALKNSLI